MRGTLWLGSVAAANVVVGTTRLTDLGSLIETGLGQDIQGGKIWGVHGQMDLIGTVGGAQNYSYGLFIGPNSLDAADVFPNSGVGDINWWKWGTYLHRGQAHQLTAGNEFDVHNLRFRSLGARRIRAHGETLWFAEEVAGQTQNVQWTITGQIAV